ASIVVLVSFTTVPKLSIDPTHEWHHFHQHKPSTSSLLYHLPVIVVFSWLVYWSSTLSFAQSHTYLSIRQQFVSCTAEELGQEFSIAMNVSLPWMVGKIPNDEII